MQQGKAFIFSAPSGSGKTTIVQHLLKNDPRLGFSISACTRDKRGRTEENGKDYYFLTPDEFKQNIDAKKFIEWEEVYPGNFYGTLESEIQRIWDSGKHVIFDVDVKGGLNLKKYFGNNGLAIFVKVPSLDTLSERLNDRGTDSPKSISQRLFKAKFELQFENHFDLTLINQDLNDSFCEAQTLVDDFIAKPVGASF